MLNKRRIQTITSEHRFQWHQCMSQCDYEEIIVIDSIILKGILGQITSCVSVSIQKLLICVSLAVTNCFPSQSSSR